MHIKHDPLTLGPEGVLRFPALSVFYKASKRALQRAGYDGLKEQTLADEATPKAIIEFNQLRQLEAVLTTVCEVFKSPPDQLGVHHFQRYRHAVNMFVVDNQDSSLDSQRQLVGQLVGLLVGIFLNELMPAQSLSCCECGATPQIKRHPLVLNGDKSLNTGIYLECPTTTCEAVAPLDNVTGLPFGSVSTPLVWFQRQQSLSYISTMLRQQLYQVMDIQHLLITHLNGGPISADICWQSPLTTRSLENKLLQLCEWQNSLSQGKEQFMYQFLVSHGLPVADSLPEPPWLNTQSSPQLTIPLQKFQRWIFQR